MYNDVNRIVSYFIFVLIYTEYGNICDR